MGAITNKRSKPEKFGSPSLGKVRGGDSDAANMLYYCQLTTQASRRHNIPSKARIAQLANGGPLTHEFNAAGLSGTFRCGDDRVVILRLPHSRS
jgi:hypothetical protein